MPDVRLYNTEDGGEIAVSAGQFVLADGLETAVYLSLFGGNEDDSGKASDDAKQWWGNLTESDPDATYRSETQALLKSIPATTGNLRTLEDAASRDLEWLKGYGAESIEVEATMPGLNRVTLTIRIMIDNSEERFTFTETWAAL